MALTKHLEQRPEQEDDALASGSHIRRDGKAREIADTPILTGDPDFDRWELEETSTPLPAHFFKGADAGTKTHDDP